MFISSPYRATDERSVEDNLEYARWACEDSISRGEVPIAPHLFLPGILDDADKTDREFAMEACKLIIDRCDMIAFYSDHGITEGMDMEYEHANRPASMTKPVVRYLTEAE